MRKLRSLAIAGTLATSMMFALPAPARAFVCIDHSTWCCGTLYVNGKAIEVIPIAC